MSTHAKSSPACDPSARRYPDTPPVSIEQRNRPTPGTPRRRRPPRARGDATRPGPRVADQDAEQERRRQRRGLHADAGREAGHRAHPTTSSAGDAGRARSAPARRAPPPGPACRSAAGRRRSKRAAPSASSDTAPATSARARARPLAGKHVLERAAEHRRRDDGERAAERATTRPAPRPRRAAAASDGAEPRERGEREVAEADVDGIAGRMRLMQRRIEVPQAEREVDRVDVFERLAAGTAGARPT